MAFIHGMADSERALLDKLPKEVKNIEDMDRVRRQFSQKMKKQRYGRKGILGTVFAEVKRYHYKRQVDKFQYKKINFPQCRTWILIDESSAEICLA